MPLPPGPYRTRRLDNGVNVPYYIIPFDADGACTGPLTRQHLLDAVAAGSFTDLFLFAHGWNNDWNTATSRYDDFMDGFARMRKELGLSMPASYRPILVGIFWPSTALVFGESEAGPGFAGYRERTAAEDEALGEIVKSVAPADRPRVRELLSKNALNEAEALELARRTLPLFAQADDETGTDAITRPGDLVQMWRTQSHDDPYGGEVGTLGTADDAGPAAAGLLSWLDPRPLLRMFTVWQMKDRAGHVGALGVQPLLRELLRTTPARAHLLGHSYGAKVVLSAVGCGEALSRPVHSILLLQPAVSHLCFADKIPGRDGPGGYRAVLDRVVQPVLATFSAQDSPLHDTFHLALRRAEDLGEAGIAGVGDPPSRYAALGGYGPRGTAARLIGMRSPQDRYTFEDGVRVYGLDGSEAIGGHGDVSNTATWWALYNQITALDVAGGMT